MDPFRLLCTVYKSRFIGICLCSFLTSLNNLRSFWALCGTAKRFWLDSGSRWIGVGGGVSSVSLMMPWWCDQASPVEALRADSWSISYLSADLFVPKDFSLVLPDWNIAVVALCHISFLYSQTKSSPATPAEAECVHKTKRGWIKASARSNCGLKLNT